MKIEELINNSSFDFFSKDYEGEFSNPKQDLLKIHKRKLLIDPIELDYWKITYTYKTQRGNKKTKEEFIIVQKGQDKSDIIDKFISNKNEFNKKFPNRRLLNVQILDTFYLGNSKLSIE